MNNEKIGVEKLTELLIDVANLIEDFEDAKADGKITIMEVVKIAAFNAAPTLVKVAMSFQDIKDEFKDLSSEELQQLKDAFVDEFDLDNDKVEVIVEKIIEIAVTLGTGFAEVSSIIRS